MNVFKKVSLFVAALLCLFMGGSCSRDLPEFTVIRVQVEANTDEPVRIYGTEGAPEAGIVIRKNYDQSFQSDAKDGFSIEARCRDENTFISIKVWVNGKLRAHTSGNKYLTSGYISVLK